MIESLYVVHLVRCYREVLVLASGKEGILVVKGICLAIVLISLLRLEILVQCRRKQTPTTEIEETVTLHSKLYTTFPAQCLAGIILRSEVTIERDVALILGILDE
jgi:hypothetical protein